MSERVIQSEIVVIGGGPAGLAAACVAAEAGRRVTLLDDTPWLGGQIWRGESVRAKHRQARLWIERFRRSGARLLDRTSAIAAPRTGVLLAEQAGEPYEVHWQRLILATGARELFLPFPGWTQPGVMGPGGLQSLMKNGWPVEGRRIVVAGSGPLLLAVADGVTKGGAKVPCIVEQTLRSKIAAFGLQLWRYPAKLWQGIGIQSRLVGVPYRCGAWPVRAEGDSQVRSVTFTNGQRQWTEDCDLLACGFGLVPNVELPLLLGCRLTDEFVQVDRWQNTSAENVFCAGEPTGIGGADCALAEGQIAGHAASGNRARAEALFPQRAAWHRFRDALAQAFALRPELKNLATHDTLLCRCEDVSLGRLKQFGGWRDAKLQTRCGMGPCQGRICGAASRVVLGWGMESVRPPVLPARVGALLAPSVPDENQQTANQTRKPVTAN